jgi:vacuolar-type H+-ATPase subunit E/Vma4
MPAAQRAAQDRRPSVSTRYLSLAFGGALAAFAVYHWLLVNNLNAELRDKQAQLLDQTQRLGSLERDNAALAQALGEHKSKLESQAAAMRIMEHTQSEAEERLRTVAAAAERECVSQRPVIQVIKAPTDPKCVEIKRQMDQYLAQRQAQSGPAGTLTR